VSEILDKRQLLIKLYEVHDTLTREWKIACKKYCSECCTDHICMTGLEGRLILEYLRIKKLQDFLNQAIRPDKRYHPKTTINQEAWLALHDKPIPEPEETPLNRCIFLTSDQCSIYPVRPMSCRTMVSTLSCHNAGHATMTTFQMSAATLFYQFIEMLDLGGYYGNYLNILEMLTTPPETQSIQLVMTKTPLLRNNRIHHVMIPPEHREELIPVMNEIQNVLHTGK